MADTRPPLTDLRYYNSRSFGGIDPQEINTPRARAFLDALHAYDPNAQFTPVVLGGEGSSGAITYQLQFDPSLLPGTGVDLPGVPNTQQLGGANPVTAGYGSYAGGSSFIPVNWEQIGSDTSRLKDPSLFGNSPTYGNITPTYNLRPEPASMLDFLGPLGVAAFAFGIPYLASAMSNGAIGAGAASGAASGGGAAGGSSDVGFGGGMGGAANEMGATSSSIGAAGAPASQASIDLSNWLVAHGIPSQFGLSSGAVGAAMTEPGFGLTGMASKIPNVLSKVPGLISGKPATGGALSLGGGGGLLGAGQTGDDATDVIRRYYGEDALSKLKKKASYG